MLHFTDASEVANLAPAIRRYLEEAKGYAEAGIKPQASEEELVLPDELVTALDADPDLAEAFHGLTRGRQRSYVLNLRGAKKAETRVARIGKFRDRIMAGKGATARQRQGLFLATPALFIPQQAA